MPLSFFFYLISWRGQWTWVHFKKRYYFIHTISLKAWHFCCVSHNLVGKRKGMKPVSPERSLQESLVPRLNKIRVPKIITLCPMKLIVYISSTAATSSMLLPQNNVDGRPVPVFFRDRSMDYHMFLVSTLFAFMGAFCSLMIQHKSSFERVCRIIAVASLLSALAIVFYAAALWLRLGWADDLWLLMCRSWVQLLNLLICV